MKDILSEIVAHKREEINALKERMPVDKIYVNACYHPTASLRNALVNVFFKFFHFIFALILFLSIFQHNIV